LRDASTQLTRLNQSVGGRLDLRDPDFRCLDAIDRFGPLSPSALARRAGLHPATMTGVLDRLERGGWVVRERSADDRRAVVVRARAERAGEVYGLYSGMNAAMDDLCLTYTDDQLEVIADFLTRTAATGAAATENLTSSASAGPGAGERSGRQNVSGES
jgi:DNA-binding MarR family transcriptional regulator